MTRPQERKDIFSFMQERIRDVSQRTGLKLPQAFIQWFVGMYFSTSEHSLFVSDGSGDGKVDAFFTTHNGSTVTHHVVNSKFTETYDKLAPVEYYDEIAAFASAFETKANRDSYLQTVKSELRPHYLGLFAAYDNDHADLMFITAHRLDPKRVELLDDRPVRILGLDDLIQHLIDDLDVAMPRTQDLVLGGIQNVLSIDGASADVATSIVFARVIDFINYMNLDPHDLLFARNVRVPISLATSSINRNIAETFKTSPEEFGYSNNGVTVLCESIQHNPGKHECVLKNPRVINGSQTLHSVRATTSPSPKARVLVRVIVVTPKKGGDVARERARMRGVISNISIRSNHQNPIKRSDLAANDDFQTDLYRYFRQKGLFYERRNKEWGQRSRELRNVGIRKGPSGRRMMQWLASFYYMNDQLGPAKAKNSRESLFEEESYTALQQASPELVYQVYIASEIVEAAYKTLKTEAKYLAAMSGHMDLAVFSRVTMALEAAGARWGEPDFTSLLQRHLEIPEHSSPWVDLVRRVSKEANGAYKNAKKLSSEPEKLNYNNFFKSKTYVSGLLGPVDSSLKSLAAKVLVQ